MLIHGDNVLTLVCRFLKILSIVGNFIDSWKLSEFLEKFPEFLFKCYNSEFY